MHPLLTHTVMLLVYDWSLYNRLSWNATWIVKNACSGYNTPIINDSNSWRQAVVHSTVQGKPYDIFIMFGNFCQSSCTKVEYCQVFLILKKESLSYFSTIWYIPLCQNSPNDSLKSNLKDNLCPSNAYDWLVAMRKISGTWVVYSVLWYSVWKYTQVTTLTLSSVAYLFLLFSKWIFCNWRICCCLHCYQICIREGQGSSAFISWNERK